VRVDRQEVGHAGGVTLPAGARTLTVDYTGLSFVQPRRVRFRHKLDGYETEWTEADTRRTAVYGQLPPGRYTFRVTACNNDGVWNDTGQALAITQLPYFHQTRLFYGLLGVVAVVSAWGVSRWFHRRLRARVERLEREQAMENERRRIAQDLHDDLGASLTEIGLFAQTAVPGASPEVRRDLEGLAQRARALVRSLDAIVWAVNPANDTLEDLATYLAEYCQDLFSRSAIRARLDVAPEIPRRMLTAQQRSNLFLVAKEAMNNVLKHSGAAEVWLRVAVTGAEFVVSVEDDGRGFDLAGPEAGAGNGLANMRRRGEQSGVVVSIRSEPARGTTVRIVLRLSERS
jgi:signal transduction histidine kinase